MTFRESFVSSIFKIGRFLKDHSPEILMVAGTGMTVLSYVEGQKAAKKCSELKEEYENNLEVEERMVESAREAGYSEIQLTDEEIQDDLKKFKRDYRWGVVKAQAGPVLLMIGGFACSWSGYLITAHRYTQMAASYFTKAQEMLALEKAVSAAYGTDALTKLKNGENPNQGDPAPEGEEGDVIKEPLIKRVEGYSFFFDESCGEYEKDPEANRIKAVAVESALNNNLVSKGVVFYNDILDAFDKERVKDGYKVGYVYIKKNSARYRKIYEKDPALAELLSTPDRISLGCWDPTINGAAYRFLAGAERSVLIRPNLDPVPVMENLDWFTK